MKEEPKEKNPSPLVRRRELIAYFVENNLIGVDGYKVAMKACGYATQLTRETAASKFNSEVVTELIANERKKHEYSQEKARQLLDQLKADCETAGDRTNKLGCIKELNRIHGLYGDDEAGIHITQVVVSSQERRKVLAKELKLLDDIDSAPLAIAE